MLARSPGPARSAENFASQWLQTRKLKEFTPDPALFPDFDESLRSAMLEETRLFFESIQDEDRSVLEFLDADYTFVNERLARHYGIPGVTGDEFRRVSLAGTPRGGVLTQASVLAATSNPTRTSPVKRGKWILENILGTPPSPPPSGVEALKEGGAADHRRHAPPADGAAPDRSGLCLVPPADGPARLRPRKLRRRRRPGGPATAASRSMPSGSCPAAEPSRVRPSCKTVLRSRRDAFARCLAEKMLTYALGRGLERADRRAVDQIVRQAGPRRIPVLGPGPRHRRERAVLVQPEARGGNHEDCAREYSRRTVLRGLGVSMALPLLEAMDRGRRCAGSADRRQSCRCAWRSSTSPTASTCPTGRRDQLGTGFELPAILEPLRAVKDELLVLSGLTLNPARALGDGGGDHARAMASFLTGRHPRKTDGADLCAGISVDQLGRARVGRSTRFPSLEIGCEGGRNGGECDHGYSCAYQSNLSWRSESTPVAKQINPRLVFDRLFGSPAGVEAGEDPARADRRQQEHPRFRRRGRPTARAIARRLRPPQAGRIPDRRPRDRAADRAGPARGRPRRREVSAAARDPGRLSRSISG